MIGVGTGVTPDEYEELSPLAAVLGAELAATRKVTDQGWAPRARQVGITGRSIAPRLYVAVGLSGKFNHMVGVRAAGTILAVNADRGAPGVRPLRRRHRGRLARGRAPASPRHCAGPRRARRRNGQLRPTPAAARTRRHDLLVGGAGTEHGGHAVGQQDGDVGRRDDAADDDRRLEAGGAQGADDGRGQREVGAVVHGDADDVDILLGRHGGDALGRLAQAGVDDLEAGVAQDAGHDAQPAVVAVEPDLGHEDAQRPPVLAIAASSTTAAGSARPWPQYRRWRQPAARGAASGRPEATWTG